MADNKNDGFRNGIPSGESSPCIAINATVKNGLYNAYDMADSAAEIYDDSRFVTAAEVAAIVRRMLADVRVYVLESDITKAQDDVNGVLAETYF